MRRRTTRTALALASLALVGSTAACGTGSADAASAASSSAAPARPADEMTRRLAEVEFGRQCLIDKANFPGEDDLTADLDARLAAVGFTHEQWKRWHDALADSPELVAQFAHVSAAGCPAA